MAEILIDFSGITIPTPEPYDKTLPEKQRENAAYVFMQIIQVLKQHSFVLSFPENSTVSANPDALIQEAIEVLKDIAHQELWQDFGHYRQSLNNRLSESI